MKQQATGSMRRFRVWITRYRKWRPQDFRAVPPEAVALEPAEDGTMSAPEAIGYVEAFNRAALRQRRKVWAVVLPVHLRYEGDPQPGAVLAATRMASL
jgi:hypothetical protein